MFGRISAWLLLGTAAWGGTAWSATGEAERVMLVVNENSARSRRIGDFYARWHNLAPAQICRLRSSPAENIKSETISRDAYQREIEAPISRCIDLRPPAARPWYLVLTQGLPIRIQGAGVKEWQQTEQASVDSELAALPLRRGGRNAPLAGVLRNPFFEQKYARFDPAAFPVLLVTRLAGYNFEDVQRSVERCRGAKNRGVAVLDLKADDDAMGNDWLRSAAILLPQGRSVLDTSPKVLSGIPDVIAYASWGSNDRVRKSRKSGMQWLPGALAAEYVSSSARTLTMPPYHWSLGTWSDSRTWFAGSPQSMILDYVWEGVSGISGATDEPYLSTLPRPHILFPAYLGGRNLAESFYLALPVLSWQILIVGDPLCRLQ